MSRFFKAAALVFVASAMAGCAGGLSGLTPDSGFKCKAPDGVQCASMSGVAANLRANNLPGQRKNGHTSTEGEGSRKSGVTPKYETTKTGFAGSGGIVNAPGAIRSEPETIRIWAAWWEDAEGDLNEDSKVYLVVNPGRWLVEHNSRQIESEFAPSRVAISAPSAAAAAGELPIQPPAGGGSTATTGGGAGPVKQSAVPANLPAGLQQLAEQIKQVQGVR